MPEQFKVGRDNQTSASLAKSFPDEDRQQGKQNADVVESTCFREAVWGQWRQSLLLTGHANEGGSIQQVGGVYP